MHKLFIPFALAVAAVSTLVLMPSSTDPNLAEFSGRWVSMENQYADGVDCMSGEPEIGMELYVQEQNPREVRLIQRIGADRLQFVFPIGGEKPALQLPGEESAHHHAIEVRVAGDVNVSGTLDLPVSASEESQITSVTLSASELSAPVALPALGIAKDKTLPLVMIQATSDRMPVEEQIVLTADNFTRCFIKS